MKRKIIEDEQLQPLIKAELTNLRKGIRYDCFVFDTPENREASILKIRYYQMAADKEGWRFNPELYRFYFLHPSDPRLLSPNYQARMYARKKDKPFGFLLNTAVGIATQIKDEDLEKILEGIQSYLIH